MNFQAIGTLAGVGPKKEQIFKLHNIHTIQDLIECSRPIDVPDYYKLKQAAMAYKVEKPAEELKHFTWKTKKHSWYQKIAHIVFNNTWFRVEIQEFVLDEFGAFLHVQYDENKYRKVTPSYLASMYVVWIRRECAPGEPLVPEECNLPFFALQETVVNINPVQETLINIAVSEVQSFQRNSAALVKILTKLRRNGKH